jgi:hypothetical protein
MELKEFIKATITSISESIEDLNTELNGKVVVNPGTVEIHSQSSDREILSTVKTVDGKVEARRVLDVEFNLVISEVKKNEKGGGLSIEVFKAGINNKKEMENHNTVKFSIPVAFF